MTTGAIYSDADGQTVTYVSECERSMRLLLGDREWTLPLATGRRLMRSLPRLGYQVTGIEDAEVLAERLRLSAQLIASQREVAKAARRERRAA